MITDEFMYGLLLGIAGMAAIHIYACLTREQILYRIGMCGGQEKINGEWFTLTHCPVEDIEADAHSHDSRDEITER